MTRIISFDSLDVSRIEFSSLQQMHIGSRVRRYLTLRLIHPKGRLPIILRTPALYVSDEPMTSASGSMHIDFAIEASCPLPACASPLLGPDAPPSAGEHQARG